MNKRFLLFLIFIFFAYASTIFGALDKKRIIFIVNPISHEIQGLDIREIIEKKLDLTKFEYQIIYTRYAGHATKLAHDAVDYADIIAAVGGDGTVNEVGKALISTKGILAIIPVGSGNGLAKHFGIPTGLAKAVAALNYSQPIVIDTGKINDKPFLGIAGIGFDAQVAHEFANFGKRGLLSYCRVVLREFPKYEAKNYRITIDGKQITKKAFILTFANSSQYGNDFNIAPHASVNDGYLDLILIDNIPIHLIPQFLYRIKRGTISCSNHYETHRFRELIIQHPFLKAHIDGEPVAFQNNIKVTIQSHSLQVMVPKKKN